MRNWTAFLVALALSLGHVAAQASETVVVEIVASELMTVYLNGEPVMRGSDFGFARAKSRAPNTLMIDHGTSMVTAYKVTGAGTKVAKPENGSNRVQFELNRISSGDRVIGITTSEPTLFDGRTRFSFYDLATARTHHIPLKGELFDSMGLRCSEMTLHSRLQGHKYRSGFRSYWAHEVVMESSLCGAKSADGPQLLRPICCSHGCRRHNRQSYEKCSVVQRFPTAAGTIRLRLCFPQLKLDVRYHSKDAMHLIPRTGGDLNIAIE